MNKKENILIPTLEQIAVDYNLLREYLIANGLNEIKQEQKSIFFEKSCIVDNTFLYSSAYTGGTAFHSIKFRNTSLFYNLLSHYLTKSDIVQIITLLSFIRQLFGNMSTDNSLEEYELLIVNNTVLVTTNEFRLLLNSKKYTIYNTLIRKSFETITFHTIYLDIINELKAKIYDYFDTLDMIINNDIIQKICSESISDYITRRSNKSIAKIISNKEFVKNIDLRTQSIIDKDCQKYSDVNSQNISKLPRNEKQGDYQISIAVSNMNILRQLLCNSLKLTEIDLLMNTISIMFFYNRLTKCLDNESESFIFKRTHIVDLNKNEIKDKDVYWLLEIKNCYITLGMKVKLCLPNRVPLEFNTLEELYTHQFEYVTNKICELLDCNDKKTITNLDIKVLEMKNF